MSSLPILCIGLLSACHLVAVCRRAIFCVAAVTDWFDGFLARRWTRVPGLVLSLTLSQIKFSWLRHGAGNRALSQLVGDLTGGKMIAREIIISALREWMAELGNAVAWLSPGLGK